MSDENPKPVEEGPALSQSTEAEDEPIQVGGVESTEDGNQELIPVEEGESTENGIQQPIPVEEGESTENANQEPIPLEGESTGNESPEPIPVDGDSIENQSNEGECTPAADEFSSLEDESALTIIETPTVEKEQPTVKEEDQIGEEKHPSAEECATTDTAAQPEKGHSLVEKECQTVDEGVGYIEPKNIEEEAEAIEELPSTVLGDGFYDRSIQTTLKAPIDREIQTTLKYDRSVTTSSLNASMGDDSASSLKECPSIEEEPPPEPEVSEILKVRAQVMIRTDSTGGWVPEGNGGMSKVIVYKIEHPVKEGETKKLEFIVRGKRVADQRQNIDCQIFDDLEYNKVMPTFHHWITDKKRYGLTFQTTAEARLFGKCLQFALHELRLLVNPDATFKRFEGDDDDDFLAFTKPAEPPPPTPSPELQYEEPNYILPCAEDEEKLQFMQLTSLPEYFYTDYRKRDRRAEEKLRRRPYRRARKPLKFFGMIRQPSRMRCKYCHELYDEEDNKRGKCHYAPNKAKEMIDKISCIRCTKFMFHECMLDPDEDFSHPCSCSDDGYCGIRWIGLCLLSFFIPCILLYPPMKGCYYCGVWCGVCGERHEEKRCQRIDRIV